MRRIMTLFLPIFLAIYPSAGLSELVTEEGSTAGLLLFWVLMPFSTGAMIPVVGFLGGLFGYEPRPMSEL